ncbi:CDP-glycerol glycerophosphotransferase family protein [Pediococcus stilesii]|uniref:CDP-glycerol glycerophosphotransferase family protein n=1 Tax=Pediococcus stilesii TaxID=331679 RepID=UPI00070A77C5|nr:CDP-glycerol glycerophosphotransferase family protein [Pediococcus stilesii]
MKRIYLLLVRLVSLVFSFKKNPFKVAYFMSFAGNEDFLEELSATFGADQVLIVYESGLKSNIARMKNAGTIVNAIEFKKYQIVNFVKGVQLSRVAIFDNYYPELSAIFKRSGKFFFQIWHANGAIKAFGWEDPSTYHRAKEDQNRFQKVYDSFDQIVVGSKKMGQVFQKSWHVDSKKIDQIGYPRTDKYFNQEWIQKSQSRIQSVCPELNQRRVILYAPTYRKNVTYTLPEDWDELVVPEDAILVLRLHPHLKQIEQKIASLAPKRVVTLPHSITTQELLCVTDTLVTDYSSIAFDFSLLKNAQSVIFFTYDLHEFERSVGIQQDFKRAFADKLVKNVTQLNYAIQRDSSAKNVIRKLNQNWNSLNDGKSGARLIRQIKEILNE